MQTFRAAFILAVPCVLSSCGARGPADPRWGPPYTPEHRAALERLAAGPSPWRLSGGWRRTQAAPSSTDTAEDLRLDLEIAVDHGDRRTVTRAALGNFELALGDSELARRNLAWVVEREQNDARVWNDYAVALARTADAHPSRFLQALEALARAVELDPRLLPASFNLAMLSEELTLSHQALERWRAYLELDPVSDEADHARARIEALGTPPPAPPDEAALAADVALHGAGNLAREQPALLRKILENHAPRQWAERELAADPTAGTLLRTFARAAAELAAVNHDALAADTFTALERLSPPRRARAAHAFRTYGEGLDRRQERNCSAAEPHFARAARELEALAIPFAPRAELKAQMCRFWSETAGPLRAFRALRTEPATARFPLLRAEAAWMLANAEGGNGYPSRALTLRDEAAESLERAGEWEAVALLQAWMAESYLDLGQPPSAWRLLLSGLRAASRTSKAGIKAPLLSAIGDLAQDSGWPRAALEIHREQERLAERAGDGYLLADARVSLAATLRALGRGVEAEEALDEATLAERTLPDPAAALFSAARADEVRVAILSEAEPRHARAFVDSALARHEAVGLELPRSRLLLERARLSRRLGEPAAAREEALAALDQLERSRASLSRNDRVTYFERSRAVLDELLELELAGEFSPESLLPLVEQAHGRAVLDGWKERNGGRAAEDARTVAGGLPETVALIFHRLPTSLLVLRAEGETLSAFRLPALTGAEEAEIEELIRALRTGRSERRWKALAEKLYDRLLAPVLPVGDAYALLIVPDSILGRLPFSALTDRQDGRALIEKHDLALAPALGVALAASQRGVGRFESVLALGNPSFDRRRLDGPDLPAAEREANEVAGLFEHGTPLVRSHATKKALAERLAGVDVLHISTHGVANSRDPAFSFLALATEGEDDGLLYAHELESLPLESTRLVYLSACESSAGRLSRIEGPLSMARGFLEQGVPAVVGALWKVDDEPAAAFARLFYNRLRAGLSPGEALSAAQREAKASEDHNLASPATWAAFQAYGAPPRAGERGRLR